MSVDVQAPPRLPRAPTDPRRLRTWRSWLGWALLAAVLIITPLVAEPLDLNKLSRLVVLVLAVLGVNLLTGYTGLISLGHGVFVGVGAFAMANLIDLGLSLFVAGLGATAISGTIGLLIGLPALRVRGLHLALITFGMALAFAPVAKKLRSLTGGGTGRTVDNDSFAPPPVLGLDGQLHIWRYGWCLVIVALWFVIARNLIDSRIGRAMRTVRDDQAAAATFGINVAAVKAGVLAISAAMAGTAGALQAILNPFVSTTDFDALLSLRLYAAAVLGGLGALLGAVFGVIALIVVPALNGFIGLIDNEAVAFGAGLIIITFVAPSGVAGLLARRGNSSTG